jgi:Holliday junction resolvase
MTRKGINAERQLVNLLWKHNFAAIRVPASGAGSKAFPKPDIIAGNGKKYYAFEVKTSIFDKIYVPDNEIQDLISFSEKFGCTPFIAIRFLKNSREWRFFSILNLQKTLTGNYKINFNEDFTNGLDFDSLLGK